MFSAKSLWQWLTYWLVFRELMSYHAHLLYTRLLIISVVSNIILCVTPVLIMTAILSQASGVNINSFVNLKAFQVEHDFAKSLRPFYMTSSDPQTWHVSFSSFNSGRHTRLQSICPHNFRKYGQYMYIYVTDAMHSLKNMHVQYWGGGGGGGGGGGWGASYPTIEPFNGWALRILKIRWSTCF